MRSSNQHLQFVGADTLIRQIRGSFGPVYGSNVARDWSFFLPPLFARLPLCLTLLAHRIHISRHFLIPSSTPPTIADRHRSAPRSWQLASFRLLTLLTPVSPPPELARPHHLHWLWILSHNVPPGLPALAVTQRRKCTLIPMNYPLFHHIAFVVPLLDVLGVADPCIWLQCVGEASGSP